MTIDLSGKLALITGASRGIGAAVAQAYAQAGAHVILLARTVGGLEAVDDDIRKAGGQATLMPFDLMKLNDIDKLGPTIAERFGKLDIFVGNAGVLGTLTPIAHMKAPEWDRVMMLNVNANFRLIRTLDPLLRASPAGRVIFTGSGTAYRPKAYWSAYRTSKAAVHMLAQTYAAETEKTNMRVNVIEPGTVKTALLDDAYPGGYQEDDLRNPQDVVGAFLELAAPDCPHHGQIIKA